MSSLGAADSQPVLETLRLAVMDNITAQVNGGQSTYPISDNFAGYRVTKVTSGNDSLTLPPGKVGAVKLVINADPSNSMNVFPAKGEKINALSANTALAMTHGQVCLFICSGLGQWHSILV